MEASIEIEGYVDKWDGRMLRGWACAAGGEGAPLVVEILDQTGHVAVAGVADRFRGDLQAAGKRGGHCAFDVPLDEAVAVGPFTIRLRDGDRSAAMPGGPFGFPPRPGAAVAQGTALGDASGAIGHLDIVDGRGALGWVHEAALGTPPVELSIHADGAEVARGRADRWRGDLLEMRQGDGRVGFRIALPETLYDGGVHAFEVRRAPGGEALHPAPLAVRMAGARTVAPAPPRPARPPADTPIELSIVVNFHNMRREAQRTLVSLSRDYQRDLSDIAYEVIAIDNGSDDPLDEAFVEGFGPEFRLFRPGRAAASPVFALNEAARAARGRYLAMMIDGAHLLSPGAIAEAVAALRSERDPVVGLRQWFIGGDQRWLSAAGYSRALEDIAFARIEWPDCGYDIFRIASPAFDSPNHWFDGMSETNCLFLPADRFHALGGFDEGFSVAGGGFANLDLFERAVRTPGARLIALIGEASFHQYHGGTTTNVTDAEKDERVRSYESTFETLRGSAFRNVGTDEIDLRGRMRTTAAFTARQWPNSKVSVGLTDAVRPADLALQFDFGAQCFARVAYAEAGLHHGTLWLGRPTGVAPADLIEMQQALFVARPEIVLMKDAAPGLVDYVRSILPLIGLDATLVWITATDEAPTPSGVVRLIGTIEDRALAAQVDTLLGTAERSCVFVELRAGEDMPRDVRRVLAAYAPYVAVHGYLIVLGGVFAQPDLGYSNRWIGRGIDLFVAEHRHFVIDYTMNAHLVTTCPRGFLRRIANVHIDLVYDSALDDLEGV